MAGREQLMGTRGTTNRNERGNTADRLARRQWLVETYRADVDVILVTAAETGKTYRWVPKSLEAQASIEFDLIDDTFYSNVETLPACRCFHCGLILTVHEVTVDRIIPGCKGGTYRRNNIRPACEPCNQKLGSQLGVARKTAKAAAR